MSLSRFARCVTTYTFEVSSVVSLRCHCWNVGSRARNHRFVHRYFHSYHTMVWLISTVWSVSDHTPSSPSLCGKTRSIRDSRLLLVSNKASEDESSVISNYRSSYNQVVRNTPNCFGRSFVENCSDYIQSHIANPECTHNECNIVLYSIELFFLYSTQILVVR